MRTRSGGIAVIVVALGAAPGCSGSGNSGGNGTGGSSSGGSGATAGEGGGYAGTGGTDSGIGGSAGAAGSGAAGGAAGSGAGGTAGSGAGGSAGSGAGGAAGAGGSGVLDTIHCPANGVLFEKPGLVHAPTVGNETARVTFKPPAGTYVDARLQLDVYAAKWNDPTTGTRYSLFWFARNAKNLDLFGYAFFANHSSVVLRHGIGITAGNKPKITQSATLPIPDTYHVAYRYDMAGGVAELDVTRGPARTAVAQLKGVPNVSSISIGANGTVDIDLGNHGPNDPAYNPQEPPQYGWKYENLRVCLVPQ